MSLPPCASYPKAEIRIIAMMVHQAGEERHQTYVVVFSKTRQDEAERWELKDVEVKHHCC